MTTHITHKNLAKPIAYCQLGQQSIFVNLIDMIEELRLEWHDASEKGHIDGLMQVEAALSYLYFLLDRCKLDDVVMTPDEYLEQHSK